MNQSHRTAGLRDGRELKRSDSLVPHPGAGRVSCPRFTDKMVATEQVVRWAFGRSFHEWGWRKRQWGEQRGAATPHLSMEPHFHSDPALHPGVLF